MVTSSCEINARLINRHRPVRAAPGPPKLLGNRAPLRAVKVIRIQLLGGEVLPHGGRNANTEREHLRASKLVLYGNHTLNIYMVTGSCEINARLINRHRPVRAAPGPPILNVGLFCGPPHDSNTGVYFAPMRSRLNDRTHNLESEGCRGCVLPA